MNGSWCEDKTFPSYWEVMNPFLYVTPTVLLNVLICYKICVEKEFKHVFYRLFCLLSITFIIRWFTTFLLYRLTDLQFFCFFAYEFLDFHPFFLIFIYIPHSFCFILGHLACILISFNRLHTVHSPLTASQVAPSLHNAIIGLVTFLLVSTCTIFTFVIAYKKKDIFKHVDEKKLIIIGTIFSIISLFGTIVQILFYFGGKVANIEFLLFARELRVIVSDIFFLFPPWVLLFFDTSIRRQISSGWTSKPSNSVDSKLFVRTSKHN